MRLSFVAFFLLFLNSCEPSFIGGREELEKVEAEYSCSLIIGQGTKSSMTNEFEPINFISVGVLAHQGKLQLDSAQNHFDITKRIADRIYASCKNKEDYDGIQIKYRKYKEIRSGTKSYLFVYNKLSKNLEVKDSLIAE